MLGEFYSYYLCKDEPQKSCLLSLRGIILAQDASVTETQKYRMPCFCYYMKPLCYLWTDKKTNDPYILFVDGNQLAYPELEVGNRLRMKVLRINPNEDLPIQLIVTVLDAALDIYRKRE